MSDFKIGGNACPMISGGYNAIGKLNRLGETVDAMDTAEAVFRAREVCMRSCSEAERCLGIRSMVPTTSVSRYLVELGEIFCSGAAISDDCESINEGVA